MQHNTFNAANEWTDRRIAKAGTDKDEYAYTYDAVGNLTGESLTLTRGGSTANSSRTFVYDVFGRLAEVNVPGTEEGPVVIARYRYNGLGMRIMWQDDADADATLESSERFYVCHDERWRPVGTFRDADASPKEAFVYHAAGFGSGGTGVSPVSYIDTVILRDRDNYTSTTPNPMTSEADGTLEERRFYCQNWRADVVAVTKSDGVPIEYVRYSSYGEPTVYPIADVNMDGVVNSADDTDYSNLLYSSPSGGVYADSDIDADGLDGWTGADTDLFYESYAENVGKSGKGRVSSPGVGNRKGYAAYEWDQVIRACHVRYRVYFPEIGRWGRRDPAGVDLMNSLYSYVNDRPVVAHDPTGLRASICTPWEPDGPSYWSSLESKPKCWVGSCPGYARDHSVCCSLEMYKCQHWKRTCLDRPNSMFDDHQRESSTTCEVAEVRYCKSNDLFFGCTPLSVVPTWPTPRDVIVQPPPDDLLQVGACDRGFPSDNPWTSPLNPFLTPGVTPMKCLIRAFGKCIDWKTVI